MPLQKNQLIETTILGLSSDGNGVARIDGQAVFVPFAAIGDLVEIRIVKVQKTYAFGRIEKIIKEGGGRIEPDCPVFGICGGCSFRHLSYDAEIEAKQSIVEDAVSRLGKLDVIVSPLIPSPQQDYYRNKAQYPVEKGDDGTLIYGFYANRSHRVIPCKECKLQSTILNKIAEKSVELLQTMGVTAYDEITHNGMLRHIYIREGGNSGEVMLCLILTQKSLPKEKWFVEQIRTLFPEIKSIIININRSKNNVICGAENKLIFGKDTISDSINNVPLALSVQSFSQVNTKGAEQLFDIAKQFAAPTQEDVVIDLYCGTGVIGLSMAKECKQLIGVEIVPAAVKSARESALAMGLDNTQFICDDAGAAAAILAEDGVNANIVLIDPPRKGCETQTLEAILKISPQKIVMVSCNPATMARDSAFFQTNGFIVKAIQPVDMFPRTRHVECVVLFEKV